MPPRGPHGDGNPEDGDRVGAHRREQFKPTMRREEEAARRRKALAAQQGEERANRVAEVRRIAMAALLSGGGKDDDDEEVQIEEEEIGDDAVDAADQGDTRMEVSGGRAAGKRMLRLRQLHRTLFFARQLQVPDWMTEIPEDLARSWLVLLRPEGDRCLLLSDGGRVQVRRKNGHMLERYRDPRLPPGLTILDVVCIESPTSAGKQRGGAPGAKERNRRDVDAHMDENEEAEEDDDEHDQPPDEDAGMEDGDDVMGQTRNAGRSQRGRGSGRGKNGKGKGAGKGQPGRLEGDRKYAVMDVLSWGDQDLASADTECRMFWLASRFSEMEERPSRRARPLQLIPAAPATPEALTQAYEMDVGYMKDSVLFLHREAHYCVGEPVTPLALSWRDRQMSRYVVDTPDEKGEVLPERQAVVLELRGGGRLRTADRRIVGQLSADDFAKAQSSTSGEFKQRSLVRCEVEKVDAPGHQLLGVRLVCPVSAKSRVWPDSWGRILFQHLHRHGATEAISFTAVVQTLSNGVPAPK